MKVSFSYIASLLVLVVIYFQVFTSNFAFIDEAHQLWYNDTESNFQMFLTQGRLLTGYIIAKLFSTISTIDELRWIRIISFIGWGFTILVWNIITSSWEKKFNLDKYYTFFLRIFLPCSISVAIAIGWASCVEIFLAFITGLVSGQLLFLNLIDQAGKRPAWLIYVLIMLSALISLFLYQPMFGAFLLPFFMSLIKNRYKKPDRVLIMGITSYLIICIVYFFLFKYSLNLYGVEAGDRTHLTSNYWGKVSFFFSQPLAQAFSFNFLYNLSGIFSQVFYPLMLAGWLITIFFCEGKRMFLDKFRYVIIVLGMLTIMYASVLVAVENFASYRTMLCINLAGTMLLMDAFLGLIKTDKFKRIFCYGFSCIMVIVGWYNYNVNYNNPLEKEYSKLSEFVKTHYTAQITKVYFIRPPEKLFKTKYGIKAFKDEFGQPSTFRDWTPEPLTKQIFFELSGNKQTAKQLEVVNLSYEEKNSLEGKELEKNSLIIDMGQIME